MIIQDRLSVRGMWPTAPRPRAPGAPLPALTLSARRVTVMALGFNALFLGLAGRLYQMQVVDHPHYVQSSVNNVQQPTPRLARRGRLITRDGVVLADNRVVADLILIGGQPTVREQDWKRIRALLDLGTADLPPLPPGRRATLMMNIPPDKLPGLSEWLVGVPAFTLDYRVERFYPEGSLAGNLTGSLGPATAAEVKSGAFIPEHQVGRSGLEASLDARLRGVDGLEWRHMNAQGLEWGRTVVREAQAGPDVHLTINAGLQRVGNRRYVKPGPTSTGTVSNMAAPPSSRSGGHWWRSTRGRGRCWSWPRLPRWTPTGSCSVPGPRPWSTP